MTDSKVALAWDDPTDLDDVSRGFIATLDDPVIKDASGRPVWDCSKYDLLDAECPPTANPSLWRQGQLAAKHGLFELTDGVYQVRGFDLSNMSFIEGETGVILVDADVERDRGRRPRALPRAPR